MQEGKKPHTKLWAKKRNKTHCKPNEKENKNHATLYFFCNFFSSFLHGVEDLIYIWKCLRDVYDLNFCLQQQYVFRCCFVFFIVEQRIELMMEQKTQLYNSLSLSLSLDFCFISFCLCFILFHSICSRFFLLRVHNFSVCM